MGDGSRRSDEARVGRRLRSRHAAVAATTTPRGRSRPTRTAAPPPEAQRAHEHGHGTSRERQGTDKETTRNRQGTCPTYVRSTHCADCGAARLVGKRAPRPRRPARGGGASERGVAGTVQKRRKNTGFVNNSGRKYLHLINDV